jgi:acyl-coenzyme A thioesterase PaaI-like protein
MASEVADDDDGSYQACYGCGQKNAQGLRMRFTHLADGSAECIYTAEAHLAGAPGVIHGGVQATLLDEVMGHAIHSTSRPWTSRSATGGPRRSRCRSRSARASCARRDATSS